MKKIITAILTVVLFASLLATSVSAAGIVKVWSDNEHADYLAEYAGDGDTEKFWHTDWENGITEPPYELNFELDNLYSITELGFLPRQDGNLNGLMYVFNIFASEDGNNYTLVKEVSDFINTQDLQSVKFDSAVIAKFLRFVITDTEGVSFASLNELEITGDVYVPAVEEVPAAEAPAAEAEAVVEPVAAAPVAAPQTSDMSVMAIFAMMAAAVVFMAAKKRLVK